MKIAFFLTPFAFFIAHTALAAEPADQPLPVPAAVAAPPHANGFFPVTVKDAEAAVSAALAQNGAGDKTRAVLVARSDVLYPSNDPLSVEVKTLDFDKRTKKWSANLLFKKQGEVISALPASGRYQELMTLPVLKRQLKNGEVIGENDIDWLDFPVSSASGMLVIDAAALIGQSPARSISPGRPIRSNEVNAQALIRKNALVEMRYENASISITASGIAMDNGAKGDAIRVRNASSRQLVHAVVEDERTVRVFAPGDAQPSSKIATNAYDKDKAHALPF